MLATITGPQNAYAVEVSGWDRNENFFVEKTELQWVQESAKQIQVRHSIASGALLFLRLIDPMSLDRVHPVPYVAECVAAGDGGQFRVQLAPAGRHGNQSHMSDGSGTGSVAGSRTELEL